METRLITTDTHSGGLGSEKGKGDYVVRGRLRWVGSTEEPTSELGERTTGELKDRGTFVNEIFGGGKR